MKKLLYILIFILSATAIQAQYKYKIEYEFETYVRWGGGNTNVNLSLVIPPATTGQSILGYIVHTGPIETGGRFGDRIVQSSALYTHINKRINSSNSQVPIRCWQGSALDSYLPGLAAPGGRLVVYRIKTFAEVNNYSAANNVLLACQTTSLKITDNSQCTGISLNYGVQYQVGSSTVWSTHLSYGRHSSSFGINMSDFTGLTIGQNVRLRLQYDNPSPGTPTYSDILTYTFGVCSPNTSSFSVQPTTCSNSNDGGFTLNFDRTLTSGETLAMVLRRDNPTTGPIISSLSNVTYTGTNYIWPNNLPTADYYLKYQTEPTGNVIDVGPIAITSPSPVLFTATWTDVDCFGANTGSISINASGGVGNYQYSINNGSNWAAFSNATTHTIINLVTGNYQVKVRDTNNCVSQQ